MYNTLFEKKTIDFCKNDIQHAQLGESRYIVFIREISLLVFKIQTKPSVVRTYV